MSLEIVRIPMLRDNYTWLLRDESTGRTAVVDAAEAQPVLDLLAKRGWGLDFLLNTHHHADHVGGNRRLAAATGCSILGPGMDAARIPGMDQGVQHGDRFRLGASEAEVLFVPGHTRGHIAWYFAEAEALFCGDTLFLGGCGRLFEGTAAQMWSSLSRLAALPPSTRVYCAHEYTLSNLRFALSVDPDNPRLQERFARVGAMRAADEPTVPGLLADELATNPFLRAAEPHFRALTGKEDPAEVFGELRRRKDSF